MRRHRLAVMRLPDLEPGGAGVTITTRDTGTLSEGHS